MLYLVTELSRYYNIGKECMRHLCKENFLQFQFLSKEGGSSVLEAVRYYIHPLYMMLIIKLTISQSCRRTT